MVDTPIESRHVTPIALSEDELAVRLVGSACWARLCAEWEHPRTPGRFRERFVVCARRTQIPYLSVRIGTSRYRIHTPNKHALVSALAIAVHGHPLLRARASSHRCIVDVSPAQLLPPFLIMYRG